MQHIPINPTIILLAMLLLAGCNAAPAEPVARQVQQADAAPDCESMLQELDRHIASVQVRLAMQPQSWPDHELLANDHLLRARLTGDYAAYGLAQQALEEAFQCAAPGCGPFLTRARLNFSMHRIDEVEADLRMLESAAVPDATSLAEAAVLRADLALCHGEFRHARELFREAATRSRTPQLLGRMAQAELDCGNPQAAAELLDEALALAENGKPLARAVLLLQRSELEQLSGRTEDALHSACQADAVLPGWWQAEARLLALQADAMDAESAVQRWSSLATRSGQPEQLDALARLLRQLGRDEEARRWIALSSRIHMQRISEFPEASYGHALGHYLEFGEDPQRVLQIARTAYAARQDAATSVGLAQALLAAGQPQVALQLLEQCFAAGLDNLPAHLLAMQLYAEAGDQEAEALQRKAALRLNPQALTVDAEQLWHGHVH
ncbi:hypothetical protein KDL44_06800 [bacterium]|nr:hypothetical protein [bacterium]